jgi:hypothetical protein
LVNDILNARTLDVLDRQNVRLWRWVARDSTRSTCDMHPPWESRSLMPRLLTVCRGGIRPRPRAESSNSSCV